MSIASVLSPEALAELVALVADEVERRQMAAHHAALARWLSVDEAATYLRSSRQRVYDLRSSGRLSRTGDGARVLVDRLELDRLVERQAPSGAGRGTPV